MKYRLLTIILISSLFVLSCKESNEETIDLESYKLELSGHAKEYMMGLKSILVENIKVGGPIQAVNVCSDTAAILTEDYAKSANIEIKRFSIKNRNPNNSPNNLERKILVQFQNMLKEGNLNSKSYSIKATSLNGKPAVVYFKPIMIDAPCLNCHGQVQNINEKVRTQLSKKYPDDKATGYSIGELRGAISVTKNL